MIERNMARLSSATHVVSFVVAFFVGAAIIVVGKLRGDPQLLITALACLCVVAYGVYIFMDRNSIRFTDQSADNVYYLGFLLTLVSVGYSLRELSDTAESGIKIAGNLGIAIGTTVFGLLGRVLLLQSRLNVGDVERKVIFDVNESAKAFAQSLKAATDTLDSTVAAATRSVSESQQAFQAGLDESRREVQGFVAAVRSDTQEHLTAASRIVVDDVAGGLQTALVPLREGIQITAETIKDWKAATEAHSGEIKRATLGLGRASNKVLQQLNAIEIPVDLFERKLEPVAGALEKAGESFVRAALQSSDVTDRLLPAADSITSATRAMDGLSAQWSGRFQGTAAAVVECEASLAKLATATRSEGEKLAAAVHAVASDLTRTPGAIRDATGAIAGAGQRLADRLDAVSLPDDILLRKLDAVASGLQAAAQEFASATQPAHDLRTAFEAASGALRGLGSVAGGFAIPIQAEIDRLVAGFNQLGAAAAVLRTRIDASQPELTAAAVGLADGARATAEAVSRAVGDLERATALMNQYANGLVGTARSIADRLDA